MSSINKGWQAIIGSSSIMSLALLGDALLYAVLPIYASEFGLTLPWVGVMLSANRFVRVFTYGLLARLTNRIGVRSICLIASITATTSTALYGFGQGVAIILFARVLWGLTYAVLLLTTLSYAVEYGKQIGTRIGIGQSIQRLGPISALLIGGWLVGVLGPQNTFIVLILPTALSIFIAVNLPTVQIKKTKARPPSIARPKPVDIVFFMHGFSVDGVFAISITIILAREASLSSAVLGGSALLAMRHVSVAIAAPLFGWIADRFGARRVFILAASLMTLGFILVSTGFIVFGALLLLVFKGALTSLGPTIIAQSLLQNEEPIGPLARMQAWQDLGAACGPLSAGFLLTILSAETLHGAVAFALFASLFFWTFSKPRQV